MLFSYGDTGGRSSNGRCKLSPYKHTSLEKVWELFFSLSFKTNERHIDGRGTISILAYKRFLEKLRRDLRELCALGLLITPPPLAFPATLASFAGLRPQLGALWPFMSLLKCHPSERSFLTTLYNIAPPPTSLCTAFLRSLPNDFSIAIISTWHIVHLSVYCLKPPHPPYIQESRDSFVYPVALFPNPETVPGT